MKKVIVISGGTDGLGKTLAAHFSAEHTVIILSPNADKLTHVSSELTCESEMCDVRDFTQCAHVIKEIVEKHGRVDCLINNAGLWIQDELDQNDPVRMHEVIDVNLLGATNLTKAVIPHMKKQGNGRIIMINSQAGFYAKEERAVYTATKWGMTGFTKALQPELAKYGIGVTGIYPGMMQTKMFEKMGIQKDMSKGLNTEEVAKAVEFVLSLDDSTIVTELGIKNIKN